MKFCNNCGENVVHKIPENDNRLRYICSSCNIIHYQNPNVVTGVLPLITDVDGIEKILLCKRAIEPRYGFWTLPAGFMENQESLEEGAIRESLEEANLKLGELKLYLVMSLPYISQVYMMFIGLAENDFSPGFESLETRLFTKSEIPWDQLAFPVIEKTLENFFVDRAKLINANNQIATANSALSVSQIKQLPVHNIVYTKD